MMMNLGTGELHILVIPSYRASGASEQMKCGLRSGAPFMAFALETKVWTKQECLETYITSFNGRF